QRSTRGLTAVDENARVITTRGSGPVKRAAVVEPAGKPGLRAKGLAVRQTTANIGQPPAKQAKRAPLGVKKEEQKTDEIVRPTNGETSSECEMLTQDFVRDMQEYLYDSEEQFLVDELFLTEKKVTAKMRSILIDWIVQVHQRFHLLAETLHLTVYIVDRYLETVNVDKAELQLVGVCAMLAASKYEETYCPELKDFEFITDGAFTKKQMVSMEIGVMQASNFDFGRAHSIQFLRSFSQKAEANANIHCMAKYFSEMTLIDASFSSVRPSLIAAGALWLADNIKGSELNLKKAFSLVNDSSFMKEAIETGKSMAACIVRVRRVGKLRAVTEKYGSSKMYHASDLKSTEEAALEKIVLEDE
ncbi:hypothetical protein PFISCL1PPCAC_20424, partial [Pristionchus fissidentatus]